MPKVKALQVLKDQKGYHEINTTFDATKADAERWIERGSAEAVSGNGSAGKGKGKGGQSASESAPESPDPQTAELVESYREIHAESLEAGTPEHAVEAEAQIRELGDDATADELKATREQAEAGAE